MSVKRSHACVGLGLTFLVLCVACPAQEPNGQGTLRSDRVIAGGPKDSLEVRHLVLGGPNEAIGRALAQVARDRYGVRPKPSQDPLTTRAQRRYFERQYPALHDRMRGVAAAFDRRLEDDAWNFSDLTFTDLRAGCS